MNGGFGPLSLADGRIPHKRRNALDHWIERLAFRRQDEAAIAWDIVDVVRELRNNSELWSFRLTPSAISALVIIAFEKAEERRVNVPRAARFRNSYFGTQRRTM